MLFTSLNKEYICESVKHLDESFHWWLLANAESQVLRRKYVEYLHMSLS